MTIHNAAEKTGFSPHTIRYYESQGLLYPDRGDNGYRQFRQEDIVRLVFVQKAKDAGFSLNQIRDLTDKVFREDLTFAEAGEILQGQKKMIEERIRSLENYRTMIDGILENCANKGSIKGVLSQAVSEVSGQDLDDPPRQDLY